MRSTFKILFYLKKNSPNKKKLSPLTNHKNTKKGIVKGGFDRKNLFQQAGQGFDKLFNYKRNLTESFEYYNTMKNGSISDQLEMQERQISDERKKTSMQTGIYADKQDELTENKFANKQDNSLSNNTENKQSFNLSDTGLSSVLGLFTPDISGGEEEQIPMKKKIKKKPKRGLRR